MVDAGTGWLALALIPMANSKTIDTCDQHANNIVSWQKRYNMPLEQLVALLTRFVLLNLTVGITFATYG
jgi:hypothetical protein